MKECTTHHHACDCRETLFKETESLLKEVYNDIAVTFEDDRINYVECQISKEVLERLKQLTTRRLKV